ncbi:MAG: NAD(P)H-dependent oxidoreductase [Candidatus Omnitrophica bacterium]|nr:NAD(P)H-dependent oxidoreductase [Candidatus Omnitrophota bacterium]
MKSLLVYYSFSGNTDHVARLFAGELKKKGEVAIQRLFPKDDIKDFFGQCRAARAHKSADLGEKVDYDASPYDLIVLGSPVWAFAPVPALNTFLSNISGLNGKRVIVLLTSGSGLGVKHCFENIRRILKNKGASTIDDINIPDRLQKDEGHIIDLFNSIFEGKGKSCACCRLL